MFSEMVVTVSAGYSYTYSPRGRVSYNKLSMFVRVKIQDTI